MKPPLFNSSAKPPENYEGIIPYRHFVVIARLLEDAFNGPYMLELFHRSADKSSKDAIFIGSVPVFAKTTDSPSNISESDTSSGVIRGVIQISALSIDKILKMHPESNTEEIPDDELVGYIKDELLAVIVGVDGRELGRADNQDNPSAPSRLPDNLVPISITLMSSAAATLKLQAGDTELIKSVNIFIMHGPRQ